MAQSITGSGPNYVSLGSAITLPSIGTIGLWFYPTWTHSDSAEHSLFDIRNAGYANNYFTLNKFSNNSTYAGWVTSGTDSRIITVAGSASFTQNAWNWLAFAWDATIASEKKRVTINAYQNTVDGVTFSTWSTSGRDVQIGNLAGGDSPATARLAELTIWNRVVDQADLLAIYNYRLSPLYFASGVKLYMPMVRSIVDWVGKLSPTISTTGTVSVADHCPISYPHNAFPATTGSTPPVTGGPFPHHIRRARSLSGGLITMGL